jgi:hypothetical protein
MNGIWYGKIACTLKDSSAITVRSSKSGIPGLKAGAIITVFYDVYGNPDQDQLS